MTLPIARRLAAPIAALLALGSVSLARAQDAPPADFDKYARAALPMFDTPGAAVAVVKDGRVVLAKGYGVRKLGESAPVDAHTLFQIASNTKAFTTAALAMLVDEGHLAWDDRVTQHLPWFQLSDPYVTRELTVRDLLTHRSGLGLGAGDLLGYHSEYSRDTILRRIRYAKVASSFRSEYAYDNVLYVAAGEVIPAITGLSWEDFIRRRILEPLGMREARLTAQNVRPDDNFAAAHAMVEGKLAVVPQDTFEATNAAGGVVASVSELAKWMTVQLDSGRVGDGGKRLWSTERTREMWAGRRSCRLPTCRQRSMPTSPPSSVRPGLGPARLSRSRLVTHTGSVDGIRRARCWSPNRGSASSCSPTEVAAQHSASPAAAGSLPEGAEHRLGRPIAQYVRSIEAEAKKKKAAGRGQARHEAGPSLPLSGMRDATTTCVRGYADREERRQSRAELHPTPRWRANRSTGSTIPSWPAGASETSQTPT